jgi:putative ABC transport system permease protein
MWSSLVTIAGDDLRHAVRVLRNSWGFAAVAVATIALAIGANTAMFCFVDAMFLRPLPYPESDRIVRVLERLPTGGINSISTLNYLDWAKQNTVFEYLAAEAGWRATLTRGDEPVVIRAALVSAHYFDIFGTSAALGRTFLPDDEQPGRDRVVLLNHVLWETRFGSDPGIVGRQILLNGQAHTVIGVLPEGGPFDRAAAQIWKPLAFGAANTTRDYRWLAATAKLKAGVTLEQARAEMEVIARRLASAHPGSNAGWGAAVDRLADVVIGPQLRRAIAILFAATVFVLLIGCANLTSLALARGISREREMAMRAAFGATRWRLVRQLLIENVLIALCGGIVGACLGYALLKWIETLIPPFALPPAVDIGMNASVLLFTLIVAILTGLLFGVAPAARTTKRALATALKGSGHGTTTAAPGRRARRLLVISEIALAFVLLVGSGLLLRSFLELLDVDPGFDPTNVLTAGMPIDPEEHPDPVELNAYVDSIRAAISAVPGVRQTAIASTLPLQGWGFGVPYAIAGRELPERANRRRAFFKIVSASYFDTLGIRLVAGRTLSENDRAGGPRVAVINETLARREFPDKDPIGQQILVPEIMAGRTELGAQIAWQIVGVIAGEKVNGLGDATSAGIYVSNEQSPTYNINLIVRTGTAPAALRRAVRSGIDSVNEGQALSDVRTLRQIVDESMLGNRVASSILTAFAAIALLLAAVGIYGVISYTAAQRTHEMGIRAALGAGSRRLGAMILREGLRVTLLGLAIGLFVTLTLTNIMASMLYGVGPQDPLTLAVVAVLLSSVSGVACALPARKMTKVDPMEALRHH